MEYLKTCDGAFAIVIILFAILWGMETIIKRIEGEKNHTLKSWSINMVGTSIFFGIGKILYGC